MVFTTGAVRNPWRSLTGMSTALVLIFISLIGCITHRVAERPFWLCAWIV
ncbi:hypothetical protein [Tomitella biformata]|nr:hypothetical protein [Tomitella biformata]